MIGLSILTTLLALLLIAVAEYLYARSRAGLQAIALVLFFILALGLVGLV